MILLDGIVYNIPCYLCERDEMVPKRIFAYCACRLILYYYYTRAKLTLFHIVFRSRKPINWAYQNILVQEDQSGPENYKIDLTRGVTYGQISKGLLRMAL